MQVERGCYELGSGLRVGAVSLMGKSGMLRLEDAVVVVILMTCSSSTAAFPFSTRGAAKASTPASDTDNSAKNLAWFEVLSKPADS